VETAILGQATQSGAIASRPRCGAVLHSIIIHALVSSSTTQQTASRVPPWHSCSCCITPALIRQYYTGLRSALLAGSTSVLMNDGSHDTQASLRRVAPVCRSCRETNTSLATLYITVTSCRISSTLRLPINFGRRFKRKAMVQCRLRPDAPCVDSSNLGAFIV